MEILNHHFLGIRLVQHVGWMESIKQLMFWKLTEKRLGTYINIYLSWTAIKWFLKNSGLDLALREVKFHQNRFFVVSSEEATGHKMSRYILVESIRLVFLWNCMELHETGVRYRFSFWNFPPFVMLHPIVGHLWSKDKIIYQGKFWRLELTLTMSRRARGRAMNMTKK